MFTNICIGPFLSLKLLTTYSRPTETKMILLLPFVFEIWQQQQTHKRKTKTKTTTTKTKNEERTIRAQGQRRIAVPNYSVTLLD